MSKTGLGIGAIILAGIVVLAGVYLTRDPQTAGESQAANTPSSGGVTLDPSNPMATPDTSGIEDFGALVEVVVPAELSPQAQIGERVFNAACSACHGTNAAGQNGVAPPLIFTTYRPGHHGDGAFLNAARNGVQAHHWDFGDMPPVEGLTNSDIAALVRYIRELQRENGIF
jgi:cytochrome c5